MKLLLASLLIALVSLGCSKESSKVARDDTKVESDKVLGQKAAERIIARFSKELKSELLAAMKEGGAVNAVKVCRTKATEIAAAHSQGSLVTIRRISDRNRNPDNLATENEMAILATFADTIGACPPFVGQRTVTGSGETYYYYKPIKVGQLCLKCHGRTEALDPAALAALKKSYPDDKATGYEVGDLRGMFVVEMKWPEARAFVQKLLSDSL